MRRIDVESQEVMNSFAIQYLSIILILITFLVGAYVPHSLTKNFKDTNLKIETEKKDLVLKQTISTIQIPTLVNVSAEVSDSDVEWISKFLLSHDVSADILIPYGSSVEKGLQKVRSVFLALVSANVPVDAISVRAIAGNELTTPTVRFYEDEKL